MGKESIKGNVVFAEVLDIIIIISGSIESYNNESKYETELIKSLNSLGRRYRTKVEITLDNGEKHFINFMIEESVIIKLTTTRDESETENYMREYLTKTKTAYGFLVNYNKKNIIDVVKQFKI